MRNRTTNSTRRLVSRPATVLSDALGHSVALRMSTRAIRTVEKNGGIDAYLLATPDRRLAPEAQSLKRRIRKARDKAAASA